MHAGCAHRRRLRARGLEEAAAVAQRFAWWATSSQMRERAHRERIPTPPGCRPGLGAWRILGKWPHPRGGPAGAPSAAERVAEKRSSPARRAAHSRSYAFALELLQPFFVRTPSYFGSTLLLPPLSTRSTTSSPSQSGDLRLRAISAPANLLGAWPSGSRSQPRWKRIDLEHRLGTYPGPDTVGTQTFGGQPASVDLAAATRQRPAFRARLRPRLPPQAAHRRTLHQAAWKAAL